MPGLSDSAFDPTPILPVVVPAGAPVVATLPLLRRCRLCRGVEPGQLQLIAAGLQSVGFRAGEVICRQNEPGHNLFIVAKGRVQLSVEQRQGDDYRLLDYLDVGDHFGEMALLTDGRYSSTATAIVNTDVLVLPREHFQRLLTAVPQFAVNISRSLGFQLRWETSRRRRRFRPKIIGLVHSTLQTQMLLRPLATALRRRDESLVVLTDRPRGFSTDGDYAIEKLDDGARESEFHDALAARLHRLSEHNDRILLDVRQHDSMIELAQVLTHCEQVFWLCEPRFVETAASALRALLAFEPGLGRRLHWVWTLGARERFAPLPPADLAIAPKDFKVVVGDVTPSSLRQRQGINRLVRHLCGVQVGIALSGGGGRGLAHLGVLRELDNAGITFDALIGASSGALVGAAYAAGWEPEQALEHFHEALRPAPIFRWFPGGYRWYLWTKYRWGAWDGMLRRYLGDTRLEQLQMPFYTVTVDLVEGREVVRDRGDVVEAILESINVPLISTPILRDGMALVDGGVLNNLPGDVLARRGCNLVIGVDIMAKLSKRFAGNTSGTPLDQMRRPGLLDTILRVNDVQEFGCTALRSGAMDLVIAPDTAEFEFADFTRGKELAERGAAAAREAIPQIQRLLDDLDTQ